MQIPFGVTSRQRDRGNLPDFPVINMFAEEAPTEEGGVVLQSRAGLSDRSADMGSGPVAALFKADGVFGGDLFGISAGTLYRGATSLGAIAGSGVPSLAAYEDRVFANAGAGIYTYDGTTLSTVAFPDSASVSKVLVGASRLVAIRADTEQFYWSDVLSTTIDALSFATAENQPDRLRDMLFIDDVLILFGAETVEFWPNTGDPDLPFQPLEGRVFETGIKANGCAAEFGGSFAWVTDTNQVCVSDPQNVISDPGLEALIEASGSVSLWPFHLEGTEFLALRLDNTTRVYSSRSKAWAEFASYGETNWIPACYAGGVFGSGIDGRTLAWNGAHTDLGGVMERRFRAGFQLNAGGVIVGNLSIRTNPGNTPYLTGDYDEPVTELRVSRDAGRTWGSWKAKPLGAQGRYGLSVQWRGLGMASQPGFLCEIRTTAPVPFRVSGVFVNEVLGGR